MERLVMRTRISVMVLFFLGCWGGIFSALAAPPTRPAGHIGSVELEQIFQLAHLVDSRSRFEYDVIHMKNAVHIPVATMVREDLGLLLANDPTRPIVFYGNGELCPESLAAFVKAASWGYANIFVYRPGIFTWAKEQPAKVLFFGEVLEQVSKDRMFDTDHYLRKCLAPGPFIVAARQPGILVVDIRDMAQRDLFSISLPNLKYSTVDRLVKLIKSGSRKVMGKKLLILDSCGGQAQWLQYVLDDHHIDYAFLQGGVVAWQQAGFDRAGNASHGIVQ